MHIRMFRSCIVHTHTNNVIKYNITYTHVDTVHTHIHTHTYTHTHTHIGIATGQAGRRSPDQSFQDRQQNTNMYQDEYIYLQQVI